MKIKSACSAKRIMKWTKKHPTVLEKNTVPDSQPPEN